MMIKKVVYSTRWFETDRDFINFHVMPNIDIEIEVIL